MRVLGYVIGILQRIDSLIEIYKNFATTPTSRLVQVDGPVYGRLCEITVWKKPFKRVVIDNNYSFSRDEFYLIQIYVCYFEINAYVV